MLLPINSLKNLFNQIRVIKMALADNANHADNPNAELFHNSRLLS